MLAPLLPAALAVGALSGAGAALGLALAELARLWAAERAD